MNRFYTALACISLFVATPVNAEDLAGELRDLTWLGFQQFQDASRVFVKTTEPVNYQVDDSKPGVISVLLENTAVSKRINTLPLDTRYFESPVRMVTVEIIEGASPSTRIVISLREDAEFKEIKKDNMLALDFRR
ncbi:uncharacterized protein METZ01_LOCUS495477 [marine metagenome]|uniref:AMIN domain-containing protein n=1 Tax=marine metagenome TaxID=408172 RepID=A0A383DE76_9ZZZZ